MNRTLKSFFSLVICFVLNTASHGELIETFGSGTNQFTMPFVPIGNPGNVPDFRDPYSPAGSVSYAYSMGKFEVSRDMINKANAVGNLGITLQDMASDGGNGANRPATGVSWNEAARYVNWLNTSQGFSPAYKFAVQPGQAGYSANAIVELWQPTDIGYNSANLFRNNQSKYFLPSADEWYKAAYYDPSNYKYYVWPTDTGDRPLAVVDGTLAGSAVYDGLSIGPADVDYCGGLSPYGVMGLGGNVWEMLETEDDLVNDSGSSLRVRRGGSWWEPDPIKVGLFLSSTWRDNVDPMSEDFRNGFRVVSLASTSVPEPSSFLLLSISAITGFAYRRHRN
jgi:sulfatase modifying factor 1